MSTVRLSELPKTSLLLGTQAAGSFADCYVTEVDGAFSQAAFVEAFYTTRLFKLERAILRWLLAKPSTDRQARELAAGRASSFAAWRVESRTAEQLLLADFTGRTRSWLMAEPADQSASSPHTKLYFGSGVGPRAGARAGTHNMGFAFHALLGFHRLYSRLLLGAARSRLVAMERARLREPNNAA